MPQNLIQMPETADMRIGGWGIVIRNHRCINGNGLFNRIVGIIHSIYSNRESLVEFEKHGISFETVIEYCAAEMEHDAVTLTAIIHWQYIIQKIIKSNECDWSIGADFSQSVTGRVMAEQFIDKIRSCSNWGELYDEMDRKSKFMQDMRSKIITEIKHCRKV